MGPISLNSLGRTLHKQHTSDVSSDAHHLKCVQLHEFMYQYGRKGSSHCPNMESRLLLALCSGTYWLRE